MAQRGDLLDLFAEMVLARPNGQALGERTLDIVLTMSKGRAAAIFSKDRNRVTLFAARGIDQAVLDAVETIWARYRPNLENGEPILVTDRKTDSRLKKTTSAAGSPQSFAVVPVFDGGNLVALLYLDGQTGFSSQADLLRFGKLARVISRAVGTEASGTPEDQSWRTYLEQTPIEDVERDKLLMELERHAWKIARVARTLGVSRLTIYNRMRRLNISPEHVRKERARADGRETAALPS